MNLKNLNESLESLSKLLSEGTWALPFNDKSAKKLMAIMRKPMTAEKIKKEIYSVYGNDSMFDSLDYDAKESPESDARYIVQSHIKSLLNDWKKDSSRFIEHPSDFAFKAMQAVANMPL